MYMAVSATVARKYLDNVAARLLVRCVSDMCCVVQVLLTQILNQEPLIGESKRPALRQLLQRLVAKLLEPQHSQFDLFKVPHTRAALPQLADSSSTATTHQSKALHSTSMEVVATPARQQCLQDATLLQTCHGNHCVGIAAAYSSVCHACSARL